MEEVERSGDPYFILPDQGTNWDFPAHELCSINDASKPLRLDRQHIRIPLKMTFFY